MHFAAKKLNNNTYNNTTEDRSLGAELVANNEWNRLKFDDILKKE